MMNTTTDTRPTNRTMRGIWGRPQERSQTRAVSAGQAVVEEMARQLFRGHPDRRPDRRGALVRVIRASHRPHDLVNAVVHEAVCRGGFYGLELAADVLRELPDLVLEVIDSYFSRDSHRRARHRKLGYPTYGVADESWGVLLDALVNTDAEQVDTKRVLTVLRRVERSSTDGMREGLAVAADHLAQRRPEELGRAEAFIQTILKRDDLSPGSRRIVLDTLAELGD